jgi:electron transport complex protein RnfG
MFRIKHFVQQSWLLVVSAFVFGLLIAVTNAALSERITRNEEDKLYNLMRDLIIDANDFQVAIEAAQIPGGKGKVNQTDIYRAIDSSNKNVGFAFIAVGAGFADKIKLVIAVDGGCEKFLGFKVLSSNETPGFGSRIKEDEFGAQFRQVPTGVIEVVKTGDAEKIDSQIVAISGATVSSEAVVNIFNTYIEEVKRQLQEKGLISNGK